MSQRPSVVLANCFAEAELERGILERHADFLHVETNDERDLAERGTHADVLVISHDMKLSESTIDKLGRCLAIIRGAVGVDNIDLVAAGRRGIAVCNVPDYGTEDVADHALMMLIAIARRLVQADRSIREGVWDPRILFGAPRLRDKTLGIIGCGRIGTSMALRGKALGMRVIFYDPYKPDGHEKSLGVGRCHRLDDLLRQSEFLSLHCPLTTETQHIVNARTIELLPRGAYVINTSRGPCVSADALLGALDSGRVAFAALDVVEREPLDDERVRRHPRILLSPHVAFYTAEGFVEMRTKAVEEARRILQGEPYRNPVNLHCLAQPRYTPTHRP